ncbi:hypothetical protein [Nocardia carnea]|uniref:hypothetical protein n=1 Tax=Nocardia carnea TaxID=37328 RepID=UPI002454F5DF|nr:hypothetical protein [Nocardia carnea]
MTTDEPDELWWTTVGFKGNPCPVGPWHGAEAARAAIRRWRTRMAGRDGELVNQYSVRLYGYRTRALARDADVADNPAGRIAL